MATTAQNIDIESQPKIVKKDEGIKIQNPGETVYLKITAAESAGAFLVAEMDAEPNVGPPLHMHSFEDELFMIHEGQVEFRVAGDTILAEAGDTVWAPRNVPHTFKTVTKARFTVIATGGNFEAFFPKYGAALEAGDFARATQIAAEHGITFLE